jgi:hypothetical protein
MLIWNCLTSTVSTRQTLKDHDTLPPFSLDLPRAVGLKSSSPQRSGSPLHDGLATHGMYTLSRVKSFIGYISSAVFQVLEPNNINELPLLALETPPRIKMPLHRNRHPTNAQHCSYSTNCTERRLPLPDLHLASLR